MNRLARELKLDQHFPLKVEAEDWGVAMIVKGKLTGEVCYYDNEEFNNQAIVYLMKKDKFGKVLNELDYTTCYTIPLSNLRRAPDEDAS